MRAWTWCSMPMKVCRPAEVCCSVTDSQHLSSRPSRCSAATVRPLPITERFPVSSYHQRVSFDVRHKRESYVAPHVVVVLGAHLGRHQRAHIVALEIEEGVSKEGLGSHIAEEHRTGNVHNKARVLGGSASVGCEREKMGRGMMSHRQPMQQLALLVADAVGRLSHHLHL